MPLPILQTTHDPAPGDLIRLFHRTELHWCRHLGEEAALDAGVGISNPDLPKVWNANRVLDAAVPEGTSPAEAVREVDEHFAAVGVRCAQYTMNPSAPAALTSPLADHLLAAGWRVMTDDVLYLAGAPGGVVREAGGLTIIPGRASYRHSRALADEVAAAFNEPQVAEAAMLHLDDPHYDALIALKDGEAVGRVGVLAVGDVGRVEHVYVTQSWRRRGAGRTLMGRALEICARSLFRHVMLSVDPDNAPAQSLYAQLGFRKIGAIVSYLAPWTA